MIKFATYPLLLSEDLPASIFTWILFMAFGWAIGKRDGKPLSLLLFGLAGYVLIYIAVYFAYLWLHDNNEVLITDTFMLIT